MSGVKPLIRKEPPGYTSTYEEQDLDLISDYDLGPQKDRRYGPRDRGAVGAERMSPEPPATYSTVLGISLRKPHSNFSRVYRG